MVLPFTPKAPLKKQRMFKAGQVLKFIDADHYLYILFPGYLFRKVLYLLVVHFQFLPVKANLKIM